MDFSAWSIMAGLLVTGLVSGFLMHRSDFCMTGAFRDIFLFKSFTLIRPFILLVTLSALLFELLRLIGLLPAYPFPWFSPPAGINFLGGIVFGVGMVLAGGCVVGVLYKLGSGSLLALIALLGLIAGSAIYAEFHGWWIVLANRSSFATDAVTLPQLIGVSPTVPIFVLVAVGGFCSWRWWLSGLWRNHHAAEGFIPLWLTAVGLAIAGLLSVLLSGLPMGVTTSYAKMAAVLESWLMPDHLAALPYFNAMPVQYVLPLDDVLRSGGAGPHFDVIAMVQVPLILGIIGGACLSARLLGEFRVTWRVPGNQVVMVFCGGIIMALGSRMAPGCNIWHLWGGLPLLTMQSLLFAGGLVPGAWLGTKALQWILMQKPA